MAGAGGTVKVPSLPPPRPKSPPEYPDLYGKRREFAKVQMLEREIGFLEDEVKFVEGLQPASRSCKEVADFVTAKPDPLTPTTKRVRKSCRFWRWLCGGSCFSFSWICCRGGCIPDIQIPRCCDCNLFNCISCTRIISRCTCTKPKCRCCSCHYFQCFRKPSCSISSSPSSCCFPSCSYGCKSCCCPSCSHSCCCCTIPKCPSSSCSNCICNECTSCYPKCPKVNLCSSCCTKDCCCYSCYICY